MSQINEVVSGASTAIDPIAQEAKRGVIENYKRMLREECPLAKDAPDVLLTALAHDAYHVCQEDGLSWRDYSEGFEGFSSLASYLAESWRPGPDGLPIAYTYSQQAQEGESDEQRRERSMELLAAVTVEWEALVSKDDTTAAPEQANVPTATIEEANKTLRAFGKECQKQADANFVIASLAFRYVEQALGASPGKATRSVAVDNLANERRQWDEESFSIPVAQSMKRQRQVVNDLLHGHALVTLLGDGSHVESGDGTANGRGKGGKKRLPWSTLMELRSLVFRHKDEYSERWSIVPSIAQDARDLVAEIATSGMKREDVRGTVSRLMLKDAQMELAAAEKELKAAESDASYPPAKLGEARERYNLACAAVERWGGKVERHEAKQAPKTASAPAPAAAPSPAQQNGKDSETSEDKPATVKAPVSETSETAAPEGTASQDDSEEDETEETSEECSETAAPAPAPGDCRAENLLKTAAAATAKDCAEMAIQFITENDQPDTVVENLLRGLAHHGELSKVTQRAIQAALVILATPADKKQSA
ncbi:MAG: hypothetical protein AB7Q00_16225 [Phycisphaerales bacterium]